MVGPVERVAYAAAQTARIGWFFGQSLLSSRLSRGAIPKPETAGPSTKSEHVLAGLRWLMRRDWRNIEAGYYRVPHDLIQPPAKALADARAFFRDLPAVNARRRGRDNAQVFHAPPEGTEKLPRYYRQNFHYQTDGYLSERSARLYDHQVEVLFGGGGDAMRRQVLVPIHHYVAARPDAELRLLDVACGTGGFLSYLSDNHPRIDITALDLSVPYLSEARRRVAQVARPTRHAGRWRRPRPRFVQAAAEAIPLPDASVDIATCIFLFHELPAKVRAEAASEITRVLKPGGQLVFLDSLQLSDRPDLAPLLEYFPRAFHEPYYADYIRCDLVSLFESAGLTFGGSDLVFLSKMMVLEKP